MNLPSPLQSLWEIVRETDLAPLRQRALQGVRLAILGDEGSGRHTLWERLRRDPSRPDLAAETPALILSLEEAEQAQGADLIIVMVASHRSDRRPKQALLDSWARLGQRVLLFINEFPTPSAPLDQEDREPSSPHSSSSHALTVSPRAKPSELKPMPRRAAKNYREVRGSLLDDSFLNRSFASAVIALLPDHLLPLGRYFPFFRLPVARHLIQETCNTNAAFALSSGLAEIVPVLGLPFVVADMVVLTKNQLFLAFKLGLALGYSTHWPDYLAEFGSVLGSGFLWRQVARSLVGLIPVWGIVPKVAVAYAGTYVVGNAILQWYLTGRHLSRAQLRHLYQQALTQGRQVARSLRRRAKPLPRLSLPKPRGFLRRLPLLPSRKRSTAQPPPEDE